VVEEPEWVMIGAPYYEQFQIPVLTLEETVAEKLRTLLQRRLATYLSDLALILNEHGEHLKPRARKEARVRQVRVGQAGRSPRAT
jgi:predicted nucleotidyltransferase component of viral defense system